MDSVGQSIQAGACACSDRTSPVVLDIERCGGVVSIEGNAAGMCATVPDDICYSFAEAPGDRGLMRRIDADGAVVDTECDPGRTERRFGRAQLGLDTRRIPTGDRLADVAHRLSGKSLHVGEFTLG